MTDNQSREYCFSNHGFVPYAYNSRLIILAQQTGCVAYPFEPEPEDYALLALNVNDKTYKPWIQYPDDFEPKRIKIYIDKITNIIYFFEGSIMWHGNKLVSIQEYDINMDIWSEVTTMHAKGLHLRQATLCPYIITHKNTTKEIKSNYDLRDLHIISIQKQHDAKYATDCYKCPKINPFEDNPSLKRINIAKNKFDLTEQELSVLFGNDDHSMIIFENRKETKIFQITPNSIYVIGRRDGVQQKICDMIPGYASPHYDFSGGCYEIGGDTLILINKGGVQGQPFIDIIYNVSNPLTRTTRKSVLGSPYWGEVKTVIIQDLGEEEVLVSGYIRKKTHVDIPKYLIKYIDEWYSNMTLVMFRSPLRSSSVIFCTVSIDIVLSKEEAIKMNKFWEENWELQDKRAILTAN